MHLSPRQPSDEAPQCENDCVCQPSRRLFLQAGAASLLAPMAAAVEAAPQPGLDPAHLVPLDKKLTPAWLASLTARGEPETYTGNDLRFIGMPVGGIFAGTLYLGGDGRLWVWNIFNRDVNGVISQTVQFEGRGINAQNGANYVAPREFFSDIKQGFQLRVGTVTKNLDRTQIKEVTFTGQYPIGVITYRDPELPVSVKLEAFSPFIPLNVDDSELPVTIFHFTLKNDSDKEVEAALSGFLENAVGLHSKPAGAKRINQLVQGKNLSFVSMSMSEPPAVTAPAPRPEILFEDWKKPTYEGWTVEGTAFGPGPLNKKDIPSYQGDVGGDTPRVVNSHAARLSKSVGEGDGHVGRLISRTFKIERNYIAFYIGGGAHKDKTCLNLVIDGKVARQATGKSNNRMSLESFDVRDLANKEAHLEIVDNEKGPWGNIGVGSIRFTDQVVAPVQFSQLPDIGTMGIGVLSEGAGNQLSDTAQLTQTVQLAPGQEKSLTFLITWHFPNLSVANFKNVGRHYAARFDSAAAVAQYVADHFDRLLRDTRLWRDTWYDSTLPYWFLNRTFANTSILATTTCYRFKDGRFWGWEGIGCCPGTCTHVWHYAQAVGRIFPQIERDQRERVDFGLALNEKTGVIGYRAENSRGPAVDGQAGTILRAYREHQMSADDAFLKRIWPNVKKAIQHLIDHDANADGILEGAQENTLDAAWFGKISWISGLYHAALRAAEEMGSEMGDADFAKTCRAIFEVGVKNLDAATFSDKHRYYIQILDPKHADAIATLEGCEIDQVFGQSWAHQVGLGRVMNEPHVKQALKALWDYNFMPDVGPLRASLPVKVRGRPYAVAGDAGLLMCTWPKGGRRDDWQKHWQFGYFNECMSGFEWQVAGHMIWEGMVTEGLAVARAIHDRYNGKLRNPYNEVECSDHYSRAMASYGAFLAACGFEYHGPRGHIAFAPRLTPHDFRCPFTTAQGWGTYSQNLEGNTQTCQITLIHGELRLAQITLTHASGNVAKGLSMRTPVGVTKAKLAADQLKTVIALEAPVLLKPGEQITIALTA